MLGRETWVWSHCRRKRKEKERKRPSNVWNAGKDVSVRERKVKGKKGKEVKQNKKHREEGMGVSESQRKKKRIGETT